MTLVDLTLVIKDTHDIRARASWLPVLAAPIATPYDRWLVVEHPRSGNALRVPNLQKKDGRRILFIIVHQPPLLLGQG